MRLLLVEDQSIVLDSLALLLSTIPGVEVVGKYTDGKQVLTTLELDSAIDLVVTDVRMPLMGGMELTLRIREQFAAVKICLLTAADDAESIKEAIRAGADGYVLKNAERSELEAALDSIRRGKKYYSESLLLKLAQESNEVSLVPSRQPLAITLTKREIEVLRLIVQEQSGTQIAEQLFISPTTVETHRKHLMQKLDVRTTLGLVKYALRYQLF